MINENVRKFGKRCLPLAITLAVVTALWLAVKLLLPFVLALIMALMVWPVVKWLERFRINRVVASVVTLSVLFLSGAVTLTFIAFQASQDLYGLAMDIPKAIAETEALTADWAVQAKKAYLIVPENALPYVDQILKQLASKAVVLAQSAAAQLISGLSKMPGMILVLIFAILGSYILTIEMSTLKERVRRSLGVSAQKKVLNILNEMTSAVGKYFKAMLILIGITFIIALIGLSLIGVDYALVGSFFIAIADLLPVLGPGTLFIPWILWLFIKGKTVQAVLMLILYVFIFVFRQAIQPKVLSDAMELPALPLLIVIWIGVTRFGLVGLLLAPFVLVLYKAVQKALEDEEDSNVTE